MNTILFDTPARTGLLPFTHTRPVGDIRCGIWTMRERWAHFLGAEAAGTLTVAPLQEVFPANRGSDNLLVNGAVFANAEIAEKAKALQDGEVLVQDKTVLAARIKGLPAYEQLEATLAALKSVNYTGEIFQLQKVWDIFSLNDRALRDDFAAITKGRTSAPIPEGVTVTGKEQLFIEAGANIYAGVIINAQAGPVYIGKDAEVLEGTLIRGPLALCEHAVLKMGAKVYGATTLGPGCKVGGELNNVVFFANSNKAHDGYLGNAVIGEWCNLGADTNCSNLKNNYDEIKIWDEHANKSVKTGLTFCGLIMGDHSKCGINTMFNTGTVVGVSCNIWGGGFPEKFIPSFCWGGPDGLTTYQLPRAMDTAGRMMARRSKSLSEAELALYSHIFSITAKQRELFAHDKA